MSLHDDMEKLQRKWDEFIAALWCDEVRAFLVIVWLICLGNAILWWFL